VHVNMHSIYGKQGSVSSPERDRTAGYLPGPTLDAKRELPLRGLNETEPPDLLRVFSVG